MSVEGCLTSVLIRLYGQLKDLRSQHAAAGHQPKISPSEKQMYQKQRSTLKRQDDKLVSMIRHDQQRIAKGGGCMLRNPHSALRRHQHSLDLHRQRTAAIIGAFPPGV